MSLTSSEQIEKILSSAENPLILLPQNPTGDAIGAGWSLYFFLIKNKTKPTIAFYDPADRNKQFDFLPQPKNIRNNMLGSRDFILSFKTDRNKIMSVRTEEKKDETLIYITPEHGSIDPRDFSFTPAKFKYDLLICLNAPDKESFGKIFEENPDMFFEIPIVNIDHHSTNDNFGQINVVNITASSTSEIVYNLIQQIAPKNLTEKIATCLLTGIISATRSFQSKKTTPSALKISSELMDRGANQQEIVRHLYKTQPFNILKLLGRVMSKLKWNDQLKLVWATVSIEDFVQSRTEPNDLPTILEKIQNNYESGKIFLILYLKKPGVIKGLLKIPDLKMPTEMHLFKEGQIVGDLYEFEIEKNTLEEAEKECLSKIENFVQMKNR